MVASKKKRAVKRRRKKPAPQTVTMDAETVKSLAMLLRASTGEMGKLRRQYFRGFVNQNSAKDFIVLLAAINAIDTLASQLEECVRVEADQSTLSIDTRQFVIDLAAWAPESEF